MDIIIICNGLGNQMSQYAFYLSKKGRCPSTYYIFDKKSRLDHNGFELERVFGIKYKHSIKKEVLYYIFRTLGIQKLRFISIPLLHFLGFLGVKLIIEPSNYDFKEQFLKPSKGLRFYYGGWHSEKYFKPIKHNLLKRFAFSDVIDPQNATLIAKIQAVNSISLHIRRGDYLNAENYSTFGAVCNLDYYKDAISYIKDRVANPLFFIFTNDLSWSKENFSGDEFLIVDHNTGQESWKDMFLMSRCKHNINSNSTFSWWAAWINSYDKKIVVVPKYFINNVATQDIYPSEWIKIGRR